MHCALDSRPCLSGDLSAVRCAQTPRTRRISSRVHDAWAAGTTEDTFQRGFWARPRVLSRTVPRVCRARPGPPSSVFRLSPGCFACASWARADHTRAPYSACCMGTKIRMPVARAIWPGVVTASQAVVRAIRPRLAFHGPGSLFSSGRVNWMRGQLGGPWGVYFSVCSDRRPVCSVRLVWCYCVVRARRCVWVPYVGLAWLDMFAYAGGTVGWPILMANE